MAITISGSGSFTGATNEYTFDQSVGVAGTLTYEDVTDVDAVGVVTAAQGINVGPKTGIAFTVTSAGAVTANGNIETGIGQGSFFRAYDNQVGVNNRIELGADSLGGYVNSTYSVGGTGNLNFRTVGTEKMRITAGGNVGIGTTNAQDYSLNIVKGSGDNITNFYVREGGYIHLERNHSRKPEFDVGMPSGRPALTLAHAEDYGTVTTKVRLGVTGDSYINGNGNLGIGTDNPATLLHMVGTTPTFRIANGSTQVSEIKADTSATMFRTLGSHSLLFGTNDTERVRIQSDGLVQIGKRDIVAGITTVELFVGGTDEEYATVRGKYNAGNEFNRSEVRFGVQDNAGTGSGFLALATGTNTTTERLRIKANGETHFTGPGLYIKQTLSTPYPTRIRSAGTVFTNLGTSAQTMSQSTEVNSGLYICTIVNKDGDKGSFMFLTGVESGVAHKYRLIGDGGSCSVSSSGAENQIFSISSLGDGRTYTLTFSTASQQNPPTLSASSTATGTTEIVIAAIGAY